MSIDFKGVVDPTNKMSIRRLTNTIIDDLELVAKTRGPRGAMA